MASSNNDTTIEYDKEPEKPKSLLAQFIKSQGNINQTQFPPPPPPVVNSVHQ